MSAKLRKTLTTVCACLILVAAVSRLAFAENTADLPEVKSIRLGFGNHYKLGCWTPVYVELSGALGDSGASGRFDIEAPDGDDVPAWFIGPRIIWTEGATRTQYVRIGRPNSELKVRLTKLGTLEESPPELLAGVSTPTDALALPATNELIVQFGASIGLPEMFRRLELPEVERADVVTIDRPQRLPAWWYGYEGVDLVVIAGAPTVKQSLFDSQTAAALNQWVLRGGTLVVTCAANAEEVFGAESPMRQFAPGELAGMATLTGLQLGPIESFARGEERLDVNSLRVPQWKNLAANSFVKLRSSDVPLVVETPRGFGRVVYVALDLDKPPLAQWLGRNRFLEHLLGRHTQPAGHSGLDEGPQQGSRLGFVDLTGQLRGALDQFDGVQIIPFWLVATLALVYIAALAGLTYWVAVRWLQRPAVAWAILPIAIVLFSAIAYAMAYHAKGTGQKLNQIDLVDVDTEEHHARGTTWFNVFSAENTLLNLGIDPTFPAQQTRVGFEPTALYVPLLGWLGLPGGGLGGMNSRAVNLPLFDEPYQIDPLTGTMTGVPLSAWSTKSFVARWETAGGGIESALTESSDGRLRGSISNQLSVPLTDCVLLFGHGESGWAYKLKTLPPGGKANVDQDQFESQSLNTYLTKRRIVSSKDEAVGYDRASFDIGRIVEVMMFHERAGATNYTGLLNRYQNFVDMSNELDMGRAILIGRGPDGAQIKINDQPAPDDDQNRHTTIYRFVLPVAARHN